MTKDDAKKVIECATHDDCDGCPFEDECNNKVTSGFFQICETNVHAAAKVLYGGNETNEVAKLAEKFVFEWIKAGYDANKSSINDAFILAEYFFLKASETNE